MKKIKIVFFMFCLSISFIGNSQNDNKNILKVSYTAGCVSDFMVELIKNKVPDNDEYSRIMAMMEDYKIHSSYYINTKTKESVFVLDSISEVDHLNTTGYTHIVYKNRSGEIFGKENFMGKEIDFKGSVSGLNWEMTTDQKVINGYNCKKATLKESPDVYVWFTPEIAVNGGPYTFFGLPGLVLESNSAFEAINVNSISYTSDEEFQNKVNDFNQTNDYEDPISLAEVFAKKENFQRMILASK